jgi:hypothetical protein
MTRTMTKTLPRLFARHQADRGRMADLLLIPSLLELDLYLDLRMTTVCSLPLLLRKSANSLDRPTRACGTT